MGFPYMWNVYSIHQKITTKKIESYTLGGTMVVYSHRYSVRPDSFTTLSCNDFFHSFQLI